jgi:hypothetical protein
VGRPINHVSVKSVALLDGRSLLRYFAIKAIVRNTIYLNYSGADKQANCLWRFAFSCMRAGVHHMAVESVWESSDPQLQDSAAQTLAEKFNLSLDKARRLMELHRAALAREAKKPKKRYR